MDVAHKPIKYPPAPVQTAIVPCRPRAGAAGLRRAPQMIDLIVVKELLIAARSARRSPTISRMELP